MGEAAQGRVSSERNLRLVLGVGLCLRDELLVVWLMFDCIGYSKALLIM